MRKILFLVLIIGFILSACEEYFVPDIEPQSSNLVFEGMISDQIGSHSVTITRTLSVNADSMFQYVSGFTVFIEDDKGLILDTREKYPGIYHTRAFQQGVIGNKYRMKAIAPNGKIYYSQWDLLQPAAPIDTVIGEYALDKVLLYNESIGYFEELIKGVNVLSSSNTVGYTPFYRYENRLVFQTIQAYPTVPFATYIYIARPINTVRTDYLGLANGNNYENSNVINNYIGFVSHSKMNERISVPEVELDENGNENFTPDQITLTQAGFLVKVMQYSLTESAFRFWDAIDKQRKASGQIFDPVNSQVIGNIYCEQDTTEMVAGFFGASSFSEKSVLIRLKQNNDIIILPIHYFPELNGTLVQRFEPDFWVN